MPPTIWNCKQLFWMRTTKVPLQSGGRNSREVTGLAEINPKQRPFWNKYQDIPGMQETIAGCECGGMLTAARWMSTLGTWWISPFGCCRSGRKHWLARVLSSPCAVLDSSSNMRGITKQWSNGDTNLLRCCTKLFFPFLPSDFEDDDEELSTEAPGVLMHAILTKLIKQLIRFKIEAFVNTLLFKRGASKPAGTQGLCRGLVIATFWNQELAVFQSLQWLQQNEHSWE